jgi:hypothetical protein
MSLVPGAQGQKSVFPDDIQVNHISENTVGHGSRVKGVTDPTTYPVLTGDVGETVSVTGTGSYTPTTGVWKSVASITLQPGKWIIYGRAWQSNGATPPSSPTLLLVGIGTAQDSGPGTYVSVLPVPTANYWNIVNCYPLIVTINAATTYYLNMDFVFTTLNNGSFDGSSSNLQAVRIA